MTALPSQTITQNDLVKEASVSVAVAVEAINSLLRKVRSPLPTFLSSSGTTGGTGAAG